VFVYYNPDLYEFEGWMDKKMIFNGLEASCFHNHFALIIKYLGAVQQYIPSTHLYHNTAI